MCSLLLLVTKVLTNARRADLFWVSLEGYSPSWQRRQWAWQMGTLHPQSGRRKMTTNAHITSSFLHFSPLWVPSPWVPLPTLRVALPPQFNCSGNTPVDMPRALPRPEDMPIHSSWHWRLTIRAVVSMVLCPSKRDAEVLLSLSVLLWNRGICK